jgi:hypothetical protein
MPMHFLRTARNEQGIDCEVRWSDKTGVVEVCLFEYRFIECAREVTRQMYERRTPLKR